MKKIELIIQIIVGLCSLSCLVYIYFVTDKQVPLILHALFWVLAVTSVSSIIRIMTTKR